jgi:hypothetical protein
VFEIFIGMFADLTETFFYYLSVFKENSVGKIWWLICHKRLRGNGAMCLAVSFRQTRYLSVVLCISYALRGENDWSYK